MGVCPSQLEQELQNNINRQHTQRLDKQQPQQLQSSESPNDNLQTTSIKKSPIPKGKINKEFHPMLDFHNIVREKNGLKPLRWDDRLATKAQQWGEYLKMNEKCNMRHPTRSKSEQNRFLPNNMGQNLYKGLSSPEPSDWARSAIQGWYNECEMYDSNLIDDRGVPSNFSEIGHFTQVNWEDTKKVGCSHIECNQGDVFGQLIVCNYDKGNIAGQFPEKVKFGKENCPASHKWLQIDAPLRND